MKVLVTVASKHGSTYEIGEAISQELRANDIDADLKEASAVSSVGEYDAVVLGSAVYAGDWLPQARTFARRFRGKLSQRPVWLFSSGPVGAEHPQPVNDLKKLAEALGAVKVRDHRVFVGKLDPDDMGLRERLITKVAKAPIGDFRDWDEIRAWARGIAAEIKQLTPISEPA